MVNERWQARLNATKKVPQEVILPKIERGLDKLQSVPKKFAIPAVAGVGLLLPAAVYTTAAFDQSPHDRSEEVADFLDNRQMETATAILMAAGIAITLNSYAVGKRNDEPLLHALRVSGPALLTAAAGTTLVDIHTPISYAIPAGLAWAGAYTTALDNVVNTFQGTRKADIRLSSFAANAGIAASGATIFLAAANKL
jgi:nitroreductase